MSEVKKVFQTAIFTQIQLRNYSLQQQCPCEKRWTLRRQWPQHLEFFCDVCSEEPPYHTAEELWEGLKQGDEGARLLFLNVLTRINLFWG